MDQEKIGKFIAYRRKSKNLTQEQLAEKIGVTSKSISRWEKGQTMPDASLYNPLWKELDITINDLLNGEKTNNFNVKKHNLSVWEIIFIIIGSPIWLSLLIAIFAILISVYVSMWSIVISIWAAFISLLISAIACLFLFLSYCFSGNFFPGLAIMGIMFISSGLSILMFFASKALTNLLVLLTKRVIFFVKNKSNN